MKTIFKGNNFAIVWNIIDSSTHTPFDFSGMKVEVGLYSECCKKAIKTYNISNGTIEFEVESEELQNGVYNLMCRYSTENEQAYCIYKRAFQITGKPEFASNVETIILESKASHIDATDHDDPIPDFENCQLIAQELFKENFRLPQLTAHRAIADEHGNRIPDTYVTRESVTKHIRKTYNQQFLENPPLITEGYITPQMLSDETRQLLEESGATINNLPDGEDLQSVHGVLKLANKQHNPNSYSGLGRQYLRKNIVAGQNILTQSMLQWPNTIYIIQYDYDLNGETITIPAGCTLDFQGGSFNSGKIKFNKTSIIGLACFKDVIAAGSIKNKEIYSSFVLGNDRANLLSSWSSLGSLLVIDTKEVLHESLHLHGNINCLFDIKFSTENIDKAIYIDEEFDIDNISIDCSDALNCRFGVFVDKQYNTTKKTYYNINVKNVQNKTYIDKSATGCCFVQSKDSVYNQFDIDIKGRIENIHSANDGIVGNPSGSCGGLIISINNNQQGQIIDIHDMYVYNVIEAEKIVEDSDGISILANDGSDGLLNKVSIHNCTIKYCGRRNIKAQIPGLHIYDCLLDLDYTDGNDNICSQIAIGVQAKNIQIQNCRIIRKSVSGLYGIHINNSANCSIDNVYLEMNGYNHIHATGNCANLNINAIAYSTPENGEENALPERAVCILEGGNITGTINLKSDSQKYSIVGLHNCNGNDNLYMTISGISYWGINISYSNNLIISNCKLKTLAASIVVPTNVSNIEIVNNNFYCSKCFSVTAENTNNIKFINNIVESYDESLTYPIIVFGRCKNIIVKNNCIKNVSDKTYAINCFQVENVTILDNKIHSNHNCVTIGGTKISMINNLFSGNFTNYVETQYGMENENYYFYNNNFLNSEKVIEGQMKYNHSVHKNMVWNGNKWEYITTTDNLKTNGNFNDKPSNPPIGFQYLCQDRQTSEGATNGIVLYHKGNNIWVDALGRVVE